ncbi:TPA: hypothetical protein ENS27_13515 [bacterium]|nr:hypothetical protein [bacterium]
MEENHDLGCCEHCHENHSEENTRPNKVYKWFFTIIFVPFCLFAISHYIQGQIAIRKGKWKLVFIREFYYFNPFSRENKSEMVKSWGLYDMVNDPFENNNVFEKYPDVVRQLKKQYAEWCEKTGAVEWDKVNIWN